MSPLPETQINKYNRCSTALHSTPFLPPADVHDEPLHAVLTGGPVEAPHDGVEGGVAGHHRASHPLEAGQYSGLLLLPRQPHVDQDAVHEDVGVRGQDLLDELEVLHLDLRLEIRRFSSQALYADIITV